MNLHETELRMKLLRELIGNGQATLRSHVADSRQNRNGDPPGSQRSQGVAESESEGEGA